MASGGQKRTRSERVAALETRPSKWERAWANLRRRDVLVRLALCLATAVALCLVIHGWDPPFAHRAGQTTYRDVTARVAFSRVDSEETHDARQRAQWEVPYVYTHDPEPLVRLRSQLRNAVAEVMAAATYEDLKKLPVWSQFQPKADGGPKLGEAQLKKRFGVLKNALAGDKNLQGFEQAVAAALAPFQQRGLLEKLDQPRGHGGQEKAEQPLGQGNQEEIAVHLPGQPEPKIRRVSEVQIGNGSAIQEGLRSHLKPPELADLVFDWLQPRLKAAATLKLDKVQTQRALDQAAAAVEDVKKAYTPGEILVLANEPLTDDRLALLKLEHDTFMKTRTPLQRVLRATALVAFILGMFALCGLYLRDRERRLVVSLRRLATMLVMAVLTVALSCWASADAWRAEIIPLLLFGQIVAIAYSRELALLFSGVVAMIIALALGNGLWPLLVLLGVTTTAVLQLRRVRSRSKLIYVGLYAGLVAMLLSFGVAVIEKQPTSLGLLVPIAAEASRTALWTVGAGFLMTGLLPFIESFFGVLTDISLLELGDVSHPLLQELVRRAPSTYNHSITVGSIAEAAADAIGVRGLLVRVGAYFHDIGKMLKPEYFAENQSTAGSRHESLIPAMSTLVIVAHIKDGADLARQHKLPEPIIDFIEQHHGTTLVDYFFHLANEQSQTDPNGAEVDESSFRYPGPRPQTKEAAVLMLTDSAESACRSLRDPAPSRIEALVREIAERKLDDGQFDESNLTLRELRTIERSIVKSLIANYHGRVKYPDQKTA
jgi:putative nucleotidyltransferase with HDIG domain